MTITVYYTISGPNSDSDCAGDVFHPLLFATKEEQQRSLQKLVAELLEDEFLDFNDRDVERDVYGDILSVRCGFYTVVAGEQLLAGVCV